jgi:hypothetical protein
MKKNVPNPGSNAALELGCTCPVLDNHYGKGFPELFTDIIGGKCFWIAQDCPVHQPVKKVKKCKAKVSPKKSKNL